MYLTSVYTFVILFHFCDECQLLLLFIERIGDETDNDCSVNGDCNQTIFVWLFHESSKLFSRSRSLLFPQHFKTCWQHFGAIYVYFIIIHFFPSCFFNCVPIEFGIVAVIFSAALAYFPSRPPFPPSVAAASQRLSYGRSFCRLLRYVYTVAKLDRKSIQFLPLFIYLFTLQCYTMFCRSFLNFEIMESHLISMAQHVIQYFLH